MPTILRCLNLIKKVYLDRDTLSYISFERVSFEKFPLKRAAASKMRTKSNDYNSNEYVKRPIG